MATLLTLPVEALQLFDVFLHTNDAQQLASTSRSKLMHMAIARLAAYVNTPTPTRNWIELALALRASTVDL